MRGITWNSEFELQINSAEFQLGLPTMVNDIVALFEDTLLADEGGLHVKCSTNIDTLRSLVTEFFEAWTISSRLVIEAVGAERVFSVLKMISTARVVTWDYNEYTYFENLPDVITIYRGGGGGDKETLKGYSWSTDLAVAESFSLKHTSGCILVGEILKNDVLLLNSDESELVAAPNTIRNVSLYRRNR